MYLFVYTCGLVREEQEEASQHREVYHAKYCPMYKKSEPKKPEPLPPEEKKIPVPEDTAHPLPSEVESQTPDIKPVEEGDKNGDFKRFRQDSTCSCGAELMSPEESKAKFGVTDIREEVDSEGAITFKAFPDASGGAPRGRQEGHKLANLQSQETAAASGAEMVSSKADGDVTTTEVSMSAASAMSARPEAPPFDMGSAADHDLSGGQYGHMSGVGADLSDRRDMHLGAERSDGGGSGPATGEGKAADACAENKGSLTSSPQKQHGNVSSYECDQASGQEGGPEGKAGEDEDDVFDGSISSSVPVLRPGEDGSGQPSSGIISRAVGSITSLGSSIASNSPNFSSIVDFSSGLFTRSQDERGRVKDVSDLGTPPRNSWTIGEESLEGKTIDELVSMSEGVIIDRPEPSPAHTSSTSEETVQKPDIEIENAVKMDEKADMFKSLDGKSGIQITTL